MPIELEDGFYATHDLAHVTCIGIESARLNDCTGRVTASREKGVFGHPRFGFEGDNLDFLVEMPWVEVVWFWDVSLKNIEGLYSLRGLKHFGIHPRRPAIDFSRFPDLEFAVVEPKARDHGLGAVRSLKRLHIWHFHPKSRSFSTLEFPGSLEELQVNWSNVETLDSLPSLPDLRRLEVHRCRNLVSLGDLPGKYPNLECLVVRACGRLPHSEGVRIGETSKSLRHGYVLDEDILR